MIQIIHKIRKTQIIKVIREQFGVIGIRLREAKDYVDNCIGKYSIFPKIIAQEDVDTITEKLEPYNVTISTVGFY